MAPQTLNAQAELQSQKEQVSRLQEEMSALQRSYDDKCGELSSFLRKYKEKGKELEEAKMQLQAERFSNRSVLGVEIESSRLCDWLIFISDWCKETT